MLPPLPRVPAQLVDAADLLTRLMNLVAIGVAHCDLHPESYLTPTGRLFASAIDEEAFRLLGRAKSIK